ncbi:MAG TPA: glycosyltransferase family 2 protein, partial [Phycisphaerae bacterium]|nr:glycosyltransferase family 2 protein [Phycisphaerae bacterium]
MSGIDWIILAAGWFVCLAWIDRAARLAIFLRRYPPLVRQPAPALTSDPSVCVIVAARNEADAIAGCLDSLAAQDWRNLHIVAVDDRSDDATGTLMDRSAADSPRVTVVHIRDLPAGWLGKNHANAAAAALPVAREANYLLFTDGDVIFAADAVRRAVGCAERGGLDHLCLTPDIAAHGVLERAVCHFFGFCYLLKCKPWRIPDPRARQAFSGVGAFNLVRREAYVAAGGHEPLRLEVLDDYKLGKLIKSRGGRCLLLDGRSLMRVRWQQGLGGFVRGLEKNAFAGCDFSLLRLAQVIVMILMVFVMPWILGVALVGPARWGW